MDAVLREVQLSLSIGLALVAAIGLGDAPARRAIRPGGRGGAADLVRLAPPAAGRLVELAVARGQQVQPGAPVFRVEAPEDTAMLAEALARVAQQEAQAQDLATGSRAEELDVIA